MLSALLSTSTLLGEGGQASVHRVSYGDGTPPFALKIGDLPSICEMHQAAFEGSIPSLLSHEGIITHDGMCALWGPPPRSWACTGAQT